MVFSCARCGSSIGTYRIEVYRIEDNELIGSRDYCDDCVERLFEGDMNAVLL